MTKQYRLLKELPMIKQYTIFSLGDKNVIGDDKVSIIFNQNAFPWLIEDGWIEEVKEKMTLAEKFKNIYNNPSHYITNALVEIAKAHFLEIAPDDITNPMYDAAIESYKQAIKDAE